MCKLYGSKCSKVNDARYELFCQKSCTAEQLPPTSDALKLHIARVNYQATIWRHSLQPKPDIPSPDGHGWKVNAGNIDIDWSHQEALPQELLALVSCHCATGCETNRCSCRRATLVCTDACSCKGCQNRPGGDHEDDGGDHDGLELPQSEEQMGGQHSDDSDSGADPE